MITIKVIFYFLSKKDTELLKEIMEKGFIKKSVLNNYNTLFAKRLLNAYIVTEQDISKEEYEALEKEAEEKLKRKEAEAKANAGGDNAVSKDESINNQGKSDNENY